VNSQPNKQVIRRILVALDGSASSEAALEAAADVARLLGAKLIGIFVEDINLLRVAQLSFVREIGFTDGELHEIDVLNVERHWGTQTSAAQRRLLESAHEKGLAWSFLVARGSVTQTLLAASEDMDLLAIGRLGRTIAPKGSLGSTARELLMQSERSLLLLKEAVDLAQPIMLLFDGSEVSRRALTIASALAERSGRLRVLMWSEDDDAVRRQKGEIADELQHHELEISYRRFYASDIDRIFALLQTANGSLLVAGVSNKQLSTPLIERIYVHLERPLLVVR